MANSLHRLVCIAFLAAGSPAAAQFKCDAPATNVWLKQPSASQRGAEVPASRVQPVTRDVSRAVAMLQAPSFVPLNNAEVARFSALTPKEIAAKGERFRPYLVRAVFPTSNPQLIVQWSGSDLHVFAEGLGCASFEQRPIIVFLDRKPKAIFVTASAAL